jgi:hypothetical protein
LDYYASLSRRKSIRTDGPILIDGISSVAVVGGLIRVDCVTIGPNNQKRPSGTLLIPGPAAGSVLTALVNAMKELQRKQQEQATSPGGSQEDSFGSR